MHCIFFIFLKVNAPINKAEESEDIANVYDSFKSDVLENDDAEGYKFKKVSKSLKVS